jgi:hypothetical protein
MVGPWKLRGYILDGLLGSGSSADVWRARVTGSDEPVALKRIAVDDAEQTRRALAEAGLLCALDHPHLVRLHAVVPTDEAIVLVLDLADGGSLRDLLNARGRLTPGEVITAVAPIAAALAYLHGEGVVHGDVSAANILFTRAGSPLLADVGVARLTGDDAEAESTPAYVDPAVVIGGVPRPQSDVFMLAGVALHALTGTPTWPTDTADDALALAARGVLDDVAERLAAADVPVAMSAVLCRALSVDPHRRGTAADLALDLRHSGTPVAVELAAGLARAAPAVWVGPRHAAAVGPRPAAASVAPPEPALDHSRPAFERPSGLPPHARIEPPTRMVGPRPRPTIPRPRKRSPVARVVRLVAPSPAATATAALALAVAVAVGGALWARADGTAPPARARSRQPAASTPSPTPERVDVVATLASLDASRAKAFATRDARLLEQVYIPGRLLTLDEHLLTRIVPAGCGLFGAHTAYGEVRARVLGPTVRVSAAATLSAATLVCHGRKTGRSRMVGPVILHLTLRRTKAGLRIADQQAG